MVVEKSRWPSLIPLVPNAGAGNWGICSWNSPNLKIPQVKACVLAVRLRYDLNSPAWEDTRRALPCNDDQEEERSTEPLTQSALVRDPRQADSAKPLALWSSHDRMWRVLPNERDTAAPKKTVRGT